MLKMEVKKAKKTKNKDCEMCSIKMNSLKKIDPCKQMNLDDII
jgi:hypothetical protein